MNKEQVLSLIAEKIKANGKGDITASALATVLNGVAEAFDKAASVTYAELKALRDSSSLIPGMQYRITDYECTTVQEGTRSAGHKFDIIVTANANDALSEEAKAISHGVKEYGGFILTGGGNILKLVKCSDMDEEYDGNTYYCFYLAQEPEVRFYTLEQYPDNLVDLYANTGESFEVQLPVSAQQEVGVVASTFLTGEFADNNLAAWKIMYCLDNDNVRYPWVSVSEYIEVEALDGRFYKAFGIPGMWMGQHEVIFSPGEVGGAASYGDDEDTFNTYVTSHVNDDSLEGKGVIYYMKDEFDNECPYDFKNIQFLRKITTAEGISVSDDGEDAYVYTFDVFNGMFHVDESLNTIEGVGSAPCFGNVVKSCDNPNLSKYGCMLLGGNVFLTYTRSTGKCNKHNYNKLGINCSGNVLEEGCTHNEFAGDNTDNILKACSYGNKIGLNSSQIKFVGNIGSWWRACRFLDFGGDILKVVISWAGNTPPSNIIFDSGISYKTISVDSSIKQKTLVSVNSRGEVVQIKLGDLTN